MYSISQSELIDVLNCRGYILEACPNELRVSVGGLLSVGPETCFEHTGCAHIISTPLRLFQGIQPLQPKCTRIESIRALKSMASTLIGFRPFADSVGVGYSVGKTIEILDSIANGYGGWLDAIYQEDSL